MTTHSDPYSTAIALEQGLGKAAALKFADGKVTSTKKESGMMMGHRFWQSVWLIIDETPAKRKALAAVLAKAMPKPSAKKKAAKPARKAPAKKKPAKKKSSAKAASKKKTVKMPAQKRTVKIPAAKKTVKMKMTPSQKRTLKMKKGASPGIEIVTPTRAAAKKPKRRASGARGKQTAWKPSPQDTLVANLKEAAEAARKSVKGKAEFGAFNFDSPAVLMPRGSDAAVLAALSEVGIGGIKSSTREYKGRWMLTPPVQSGRGLRTTAADAMDKVLTKRGYDVKMYYAMD